MVPFYKKEHGSFSGQGRPQLVGRWVRRGVGAAIVMIALPFAFVKPVLGQGLTVPVNSTMNVNAGTLNVAGDLTIGGTVTTSSGTVSTSGNWTNTGTYTPSTGTASFTKSSGTQTLNSGGTAAGKLFNNVTHSGAGTLQLSTNTLNVDGNFTNSAGIVDANGIAMTVAGNWSNSGTFTSNSNTVTLDGTDQSISGSTTFGSLSKTLAAATSRTLTFDNTAQQTIAGTLTLQGFNAANKLLLRSDSSGVKWDIALSAGGLQSLSLLDVQDSDADNGLTLNATSNSTNSGNNDNWVFGSATLTWQGDISSDWQVAGNWDLGFVPGSDDTAVIADVATQPIMTANVTVTNLTVNSGADMQTDGFDLTVSSTLTNNGTVILDGDESTVSITTIDSDSGTFRFIGDGDGTSEVFTLKDFGASDYFNLVILDTDANPDTFRTNNTLTVLGSLTVTDSTLDVSTNANTLDVNGNLTVDGGVLTATDASIDLEGNFTLSSGTFTAPDSGGTFTVAGNFTTTGGTFTNSSGTLTLDGTSQSISSSDTLYNLTKTVATAATLTFDDADTLVVSNSLTLSGASGQLLSLRSDNDGTAAGLQLTTGGTQSLTFLDVKDNNASGGVQLVGRNSTNSLNNTNWVFGAATITWDGSTDTDWDTASNWDLGLVPNEDDTAVIPNVANDPILATNVQIENLTINTSGIVALNAKNLTVDSTLSNEGTISLVGSETVSIATVDTDSGTFQYIGTGAGATQAIIDFGATDYYNLTINDSGGVPDTFRTSANLTVAGALNVTSGVLDISTNANTLTTAGTLTVNGGTLTATSGDIDANGSVVISSGTLTAPNSSNTFTVADDWTFSGGTFTNSSGTVTFDTTTATTIAGSTTFNNFTSTTAGKTFLFTAGTDQTVNGTFTITGANGNNIVLNSTSAGSKWDITFPNGTQTTQFATVQDSDANTNTITCFSCTDSGNNNANWIFSNLRIDVPEAGKTTDTTPTIIGVADANTTVDIRTGSTNCTDGTVVATVTSDASGNFRVEVAEANALSAGANTLRPCVGAGSGGTNAITVAASPTTDQQPTITSPSDGARVNGSKPKIEGLGLASETVTIVAKDSNGSLLLSTVGTGAVTASGTYEITLTTALPKGTNYISVTVDGVASDILTVSLTDPFGIVFDSVSNNPINGATVSIYRASDDQLAVPGTDLASDDVNPYTTGSDGFYSFLTANNDYYIVVEASNYTYPSVLSDFPDGRTIVTGSKGETFTVAGVIIEMDHPVDGSSQLLRIEKDANKKEVKVGEVVTYTINIENQNNTEVVGVFIHDNIPPGFKYMKGRVTLDGIPIQDPSGGRSLDFWLGTFPPNITKVLKYQLVVGSGVTIGNYENSAYAKYAAGTQISNTATETVEVVLDPLFDLGTVLGKVFFDKNENGIQDAPEYSYFDRTTMVEDPVAGVRIVMEDGTVVTADKDGKFSVPGLAPGRHLFRLDERSLPQGTYLTTDKVVVLDVRPGSINKVNFGINFDGGQFVKEDHDFFVNKLNVAQDPSRPQPRLSVGLFDNPVSIYNGVFVHPAEFRIVTNYSPFIERWSLEILDADTKGIVRVFDGNRINIFDPIFWDGKDRKGVFVPTERRYAYRLYVEGVNGSFDETDLESIQFNILEKDEELNEYVKAQENKASVYREWLRNMNTEDDRKIKTIFIDGETVRFNRLRGELKGVQVMQNGELIADVPVVQRHGLTAQELLDGRFDEEGALDAVEIILPKGDYKIIARQQVLDDDVSDNLISGVSGPEMSQGPVQSYAKDISVGEDHLFFVAMGDATAGYSFASGHLEPVQQDDKYQQGFWMDGKLAYYLQGKILGKYLITSSFDSDRERKELFKSLDPDAYYPIYGDESKTDYKATDTQGNLYLLIEWDKSSATWGNYAVNFEDTEFGQFSRSLYGGMVDFESLGTNPYGDARTKAVVFRARAQQQAAHNEFLATGVSLYYLKHQDVIEGSEKVTIEVRDKITGLVVSSKDMKEGSDYEMDYGSGRLVFWRPVPMLAESYSIISSELLNGDPIYVMVDYEYDVKDKLDEATVGTRFRQAITDEVLIGGTYVRENQASEDYELRASDVTVRLGPDATIKAEYAESRSEATGTFVSTDGGLSFAELATDDSAQGKAYGIRGDATLFNRLGLSSYYKWVENDFSSSATTAQQGKELIGVELTYDLSDNTRLTAKHDIQNLIDDGNLQTKAQVGAAKTATTLMQVVHEARKLKLTGEYRRQEVSNRSDEFDSETNTEEDIVAVRADYTVNEKLDVSLQQQIALKGSDDTQTTLGVTVRPNDKVTLRASETIASDGTATSVGVTADMNERLSLSGDYEIANDNTGTARTATVGMAADVNDRISLTGDYAVTSDSDKLLRTATVGAETSVDDKTSLKTSYGISQEASGGDVAVLALSGTSQLNEKTQSTSEVAFKDSTTEGRSREVTFGTTSRLNDQLELVSSRTFETSEDGEAVANTYGLKRSQNGRSLTGTLTRQYAEEGDEVSQSNIFGLTGEIDDRWALTGSYERGNVQNLDGSQTARDAFTLGAGYVFKDPETKEEMLKSSAKLEYRMDEGDVDKRQYLIFHTIEGKVTPEISLFSKIEFSSTRNITGGATEAEYKELQFGGAYRPIYHDKLNLLARYTYLQDQKPSGQENISDVENQSAHIIAGEAIYDLNEKWQVAEKLAYRIAEEKVTGFDFTKTHTWLMIHRLNYKIDKDWMIGGEFRVLTQEEAEDAKRGFLVEAARRLGEYAQLGVGYNFTDFDDDLNKLGYKSQGPFIRLTGKLYDRTPEEIARAHAKWLDAKVDYWAWQMVKDELSRRSSPIMNELNEYFILAQVAYEQKRLEDARQIYKDIIIAGQMMHAEAAEHIRSQIEKEESWKEMMALADQYIKNGQYEKAKKILEKIMEEVPKGVLE